MRLPSPKSRHRLLPRAAAIPEVAEPASSIAGSEPEPESRAEHKREFKASVTTPFYVSTYRGMELGVGKPVPLDVDTPAAQIEEHMTPSAPSLASNEGLQVPRSWGGPTGVSGGLGADLGPIWTWKPPKRS